MGSSLSIVVVIFFFHFFLLHDKKAAKLVVLRRNFKVSKIDLARWSIDLLLPLRLFVYIGPYPKKREEGERYDRREKISKRSRLQLVPSSIAQPDHPLQL